MSRSPGTRALPASADPEPEPGPPGAGALYVRRDIELESLIHGGGHERGLRAGTENAAFAEAVLDLYALAATTAVQ